MPKPYVINLTPKFGGLEVMDLPALARAAGRRWFNQTLCRVNDCVVRMGVLQGEFHWHTHQREDEFFFVVSGELVVETRAESWELGPGRGIMVPKGTEHRTRAPKRTVVVMVEGAGVNPEGDRVGSEGDGR